MSNTEGKPKTKAKARPEPLEYPSDSGPTPAGNYTKPAAYGTFENPNHNDNNVGGGGGAVHFDSPTQGMGNIDGDTSGDFLQYLSSPNSPIIRMRRHCEYQWVAVLGTLLLLGLITYGVFSLTGPSPSQRPCVTPFSTILGETAGVVAYSNCHHEYNYYADSNGAVISIKNDNAVSVGIQRYYTGVKWHALEYVRRAWLLTGLVTFPSLQSADMLMAVRSLVDYAQSPRRTVGLLAVYNYHEKPHRSGDAGAAAAADLKKGENSTADEDNIITLAGRPLSGARGSGYNKTLEALKLPRPGDVVVYAVARHTLPSSHAALVARVEGPVSLAKLPPSLRAVWAQRHLGPLAPEVRLGTGAAEGGARAAVPVADPEAFFLVYVAEQNWDNRRWGSDEEAGESDSRSRHNSNSNNDDKGKQTRSKAKGSGGKDAPKAKTGGEFFTRPVGQQPYSRVLLLAEYVSNLDSDYVVGVDTVAHNDSSKDSDGGIKKRDYYMQDTHNNPILGWVRPQRHDFL